MERLKHISVLFLASWMTLSAGGFALFSHHCSCSGEAHTSLLFEQTCTHLHQESEEAGSCCALPIEDDGHQCPSREGKPCCESNPLVFLKTSDFTTASLKDVKVPLRLLPAAIAAEVTLTLSEKDGLQSIFPPPLLSYHLRKHILLFSGAFHSALS